MHGIVLILWGEILFWSLMGVRLFHCKEREGWESRWKRLSWWAVIDYVFKPIRLLTGMRERTSSCRPCASFLCVENSPLLQLGEIHCLKDHWVTSHTLFKTRSPENTAYWLNTHTAVLFDVSAAIARNKLSTQIHVKSYRRNFEGKCRAHSDFLKFFPQICKAHAACEHLRLYAIVVSKIIRHPSRL